MKAEIKTYQDNATCRCAVCGRIVTSGFVWDDTDVFCSEACAASVFDGDEGCVNILIDDGRMVWKEKFNE